MHDLILMEAGTDHRANKVGQEVREYHPKVSNQVLAIVVPRAFSIDQSISCVIDTYKTGTLRLPPLARQTTVFKVM